MTLQNFDIIHILKEIDRAGNSESVLNIFKSYINELGFDRFFVSQLVNPLSPFARKAMMFTDWPDDLVHDRVQKGQMLNDPVILYGLRSRTPFTWETAFEYEKRYGKGMKEAAIEYDMNNGYMFPMRRPGSVDGGISLATQKLDISPDKRAELELACMHCYYRLESLHPSPPPEPEVRLAPKERDVLQFAAVGKTFWEMSVIMGISEAAAKDSMRRAREKLKCVNTTQAVSTAIARDLILP